MLSTFERVSDGNEQIAYLRSSIIGYSFRVYPGICEHEEEYWQENSREASFKRISERLCGLIRDVRDIREKDYRSKDVLDIELAGFQVITTLMELMVEAVLSPGKAYSKLLGSTAYRINIM